MINLTNASIYRDRSFPNIEVSGMSISQAIDSPITTRDTVSMSGSMSSQNGNAQGSFSSTSISKGNSLIIIVPLVLRWFSNLRPSPYQSGLV